MPPACGWPTAVPAEVGEECGGEPELGTETKMNDAEQVGVAPEPGSRRAQAGCGIGGMLGAAHAARHPETPALVLLSAFRGSAGGQNIPADWNDTVEDRRVNAKTIPIRFGFRKAGMIVLIALSLAVLVSGFVPLISPARLGLLYVVASLAVGYLLLLRPGYDLYRSAEGGLAARLFDRASYYPLAQLALVFAFLLADMLAGS